MFLKVIPWLGSSAGQGLNQSTQHQASQAVGFACDGVGAVIQHGSGLLKRLRSSDIDLPFEQTRPRPLSRVLTTGTVSIGLSIVDLPSHGCSVT